MQSEVLNCDLQTRVATIELNRPDSLNSFNQQLRKDLLAAIQLAEAYENIRVIRIKGAGRGFCAGADLGEGLERSIENELIEEYKPIMMAIHDSPKIFMAQVHGSAAGIGAALAFVCDMTIMAEDAYAYLAFAAIGLVPDGGLHWHLYHALGPRKAFELIVEGGRLTAQQCLEYGLCNEVVSQEKLDEFVIAKAEKIADGAPLSQRALKEIMRQMNGLTLSETINLEAELQQPLTESEDCRNAVQAFFNKEKPVFKGK